MSSTAGLSDTVYRGLVAVIHVVLPDPNFKGACLERLDNPEIEAPIVRSVRAALSEFLDRDTKSAKRVLTHILSSSSQPTSHHGVPS